MAPTFSLVTLATLALWVIGDDSAAAWRRCVWKALVAASIITAWFHGIIFAAGVAWLLLMALVAWFFARAPSNGWIRWVTGLALFALAAAVMSHALPGFFNPRVISAVRFRTDAIPFTLYLNFDKAVAGIILLGFCHPLIARAADWRSMFAKAAPWIPAVVVLILVPSMWVGYVRFEPRFPPEAWLWMWANLFLTCVAEEAICRGLLQRQLQMAWENVPGGRLLALVLAATVFGVAHSSGGSTYVALAVVAGLGYGWVYQRTGRIEASILTHFSVNAVHFFFFTYPAIQR